MKTFCFILLFILLNNFSNAQLLSGNSFLIAKYLQVGIAPNGNLGARDYRRLGVIADVQKDGWGISDGIEPLYLGDYILPGSPIESWTVKYEDNTGTALDQSSSSLFNGGLDGAIVGGTFTGKNPTCSWEGKLDSLQITQTFSVDFLSFKIKFNVKIKNTSSRTIKGIYYNRNVDPDNDADCPAATYPGSSYSTYNKIEKQNPNKENIALVTARGVFKKSYFDIFSDDSRAKVYFLGGGLIPKYSIDTLYSKIGVDSGYLFTNVGDSSFSDVGMGIVFNLDSLKSNESTEFNYEYNFLNIASCDKTLFSGGNYYNYGDTIMACKGSIIDAEIISEQLKSWKWMPVKGIDSSIGETKSILLNNTETYTIISTDSSKCGSAFDTFVINVKPFAGKSPIIYASGNILSVPDTYVSYNWLKMGSSISKGRKDTIKVTTTGDYYVIVKDWNGCTQLSDTVIIDDDALFINGLVKEGTSISIQPNPGNGKFFINTNGNFTAEVMDINGKIIFKTQTKEIDISDSPAGVYILNLKDKNNVISRLKLMLIK